MIGHWSSVVGRQSLVLPPWSQVWSLVGLRILVVALVIGHCCVRWSLVCSLVGRHWCSILGHWSLVIGHWLVVVRSLVIHWLVIGYLLLLVGWLFVGWLFVGWLFVRCSLVVRWLVVGRLVVGRWWSVVVSPTLVFGLWPSDIGHSSLVIGRSSFIFRAVGFVVVVGSRSFVGCRWSWRWTVDIGH